MNREIGIPERETSGAEPELQRLLNPEFRSRGVPAEFSNPSCGSDRINRVREIEQ